MILDKDKLFEQGYLTFNLQDLDEELFDDIQSQFSDNYLKKRINKLRFDATIITKSLPSNFKELVEKNFNLDDISIDINTHTSTLTKVRTNVRGEYEELMKFDDYLKEYPWIDDGQKWFHGALDMYDDSTRERLISDLYDGTVKTLYKDYIKNDEDYSTWPYNGKHKSITQGTDVTMYLKDNYITPHEDGYDEGRLCVMLIYLNEDYKEGYGGEIIVNHDLKVEPKEGNIVILDFLHNNIEHEVLKVENENFERFALIKFFYE
tara:strand:+ start:1374 stop:2162 length:789 start_codon:yes stop_codon:yes gene_type:complete